MSELTFLKRLFDVLLFRKVFAYLNTGNGNLGVHQALLYGRSIDFFTRYSTTINLIDNHDGTLLDVGAGKIGIGAFVKNEEVISLDISRKLTTAFGERVVASASNLPFKDLSISTVVSVDCIEHLPKHIREQFFDEAKRVGKVIVIHTPIKEYCSETDLKFAKTHKRLFGHLDGLLKVLLYPPRKSKLSQRGAHI